MNAGKDLWETADDYNGEGGIRSGNAMRFYALAKMLAEAESSWLTGQDAHSVEQLRELQAHCEKMIGRLAPDGSCKPSLVVAA